MTKKSYEATITCPKCGYSHKETIPSDSCLVYHECMNCGYTMRPKDGDRCVFCSYADKKCPPIQIV